MDFVNGLKKSDPVAYKEVVSSHSSTHRDHRTNDGAAQEDAFDILEYMENYLEAKAEQTGVKLVPMHWLCDANEPPHRMLLYALLTTLDSSLNANPPH